MLFSPNLDMLSVRLYILRGGEKRSVLLERKMQQHVPQFGGSWWCTSVWNEPAHLTRLDINGELSHCEGPHSSSCDQSFFGGGGRGRAVRGRWEMEPPGGGGAWWNQAPKGWWDSTCFCGDLAQERWVDWGMGGLACFLWGEVSAPGQASESNWWCFRLPSWCPFPLPWTLWGGAPYPANGFSLQVFLPSSVERVPRYCWSSKMV